MQEGGAAGGEAEDVRLLVLSPVAPEQRTHAWLVAHDKQVAAAL